MSVATLNASSDNQRSDIPITNNHHHHAHFTSSNDRRHHHHRPSSLAFVASTTTSKSSSSHSSHTIPADTHLSTTGSPAPLLPLKSPSVSSKDKTPADICRELPPLLPRVPPLAALLSSQSARSLVDLCPHINDPATPAFHTPLHDDESWPLDYKTTTRNVIRALSFDHIFGEDSTPHPTVPTHVQLQPRPSVEPFLSISSSSEKTQPPLGTPTITIAASDHSVVPAPSNAKRKENRVGPPPSPSTLSQSLHLDNLPKGGIPKKLPRKNHLTVDHSLSGRPTHGSSVEASSLSAPVCSVVSSESRLSPSRKRHPSLVESGSQGGSRSRAQSRGGTRNTLVSPRSQASTVGTRSAASSQRSAKSGRVGGHGERTRTPPERDLARQRTQCTGPGFASLPPALARSPTSKLLTQKSQVLNDSDSETSRTSGRRIEHTSTSGSSSTPLSQGEGPLSQTTKSSTLQSIVEARPLTPEKESFLPPQPSRSSTPSVNLKKVDSRKLLFKRLFGGNSAAGSDIAKSCPSGDTSTTLRADSGSVAAESSRGYEFAHSRSAVEAEHKTFGRRALSIIGIGNENRRVTNADSVSDHSHKASTDKKTLLKRVSLRTKGTPPRSKGHKDDPNLFQRLKSTLDHYSSSHNSSMGNTIPNCCGGRPETAAKEAAKGDEAAAMNFLAAQGGQTDLDKFDRAYADDDIGTLVALVTSKEAFEQPLGENLHPWAATPKSVGALATTQLAALASVEDMAVKERLRVAGAIPILVDQLSSPQEDRRDAALVALSFLSIDYARACMDMFEAGIFTPLIELLKSQKVGVRAAAAQTARNIYVLEVRYRRAFRDAGGCQPLVDLLDLPQGKYDPSMLDIQLEAVYHIDDFIMFNGEEVSDCIAAIKVCNTARKLESLQNVEQDDLKEAARLLFLRVAE